MTDEERRKENEKEKAARQSAQAKELETAAAAREAEAIAATKATAEVEATKIAKERSFQDQAAEIARAKAQEWDEMQSKITPGQTDVVRPAPTTPKQPQGVVQKPRPTLNLGGIFEPQKATPTFEPKKPTEVPKELAAKKARPTFSLKALL